MTLRISSDIDGCLCDFYTPYLKRFGTPKKDTEITRNVVNILSKDRDFWLNLPKINTLNWAPAQYTTARTIKKKWIKDSTKKVEKYAQEKWAEFQKIAEEHDKKRASNDDLFPQFKCGGKKKRKC